MFIKGTSIPTFHLCGASAQLCSVEGTKETPIKSEIIGNQGDIWPCLCVPAEFSAASKKLRNSRLAPE